MSYHGDLDMQRRGLVFGSTVAGPAIAIVTDWSVIIEHDGKPWHFGPAWSWGIHRGQVATIAALRFCEALRFDLRHGLI